MALNTSKCNHQTQLRFKRLTRAQCTFTVGLGTWLHRCCATALITTKLLDSVYVCYRSDVDLVQGCGVTFMDFLVRLPPEMVPLSWQTTICRLSVHAPSLQALLVQLTVVLNHVMHCQVSRYITATLRLNYCAEPTKCVLVPVLFGAIQRSKHYRQNLRHVLADQAQYILVVPKIQRSFGNLQDDTTNTMHSSSRENYTTTLHQL